MFSDSRTWLVPFLLAAVVWGVFSPTITYDFAPLDDDVNILFNPNHGPLDATRISWAFQDREYVRRYMPLGWLAFAGASGLSGLDPWGYHAVNVLLHTINAVLLFLLLRQLAREISRRVAPRRSHAALTAICAGTAAFWALHPLRVEHVAWCSAMPTNLSLAFLFGAMLAFRRTGSLLPSVGLYACSLLSYPAALGAAVFFPLLDRWRGRADWIARSVPFLAIAAACLAVNLYARADVSAEHASVPTLEALPVSARVARAVCVLGNYLWRPILPLELAPVYPDLLDLRVWSLRFGLNCAAVVLLAWFAWKRPAFRPIAAAYVAVVVPVMGFTELVHFPHDRYAALPGTLLSFALVAGLLKQSRSRESVARSPAPLLVGGATTIALVATLSVVQLPHWKDGRTLIALVRQKLAPGQVPAIRDVRPAYFLFRIDAAAEAFDLLNGELLGRPGDLALVSAVSELTATLGQHRSYLESLGLDASSVPVAAIQHHAMAVGFLKRGDREPASWHLAQVGRVSPDYARVISRRPAPAD